MNQVSRREDSAPRRWFDQGPLASLRGEMEDLFESFFGEKGLTASSAMSLPSVDVAETDDSVEVTTDLPGYAADDVDIEIRDNYLTIAGEQSEETESESDNGKKYHRIERRKGRFSRSFRLPCEVQPDKVDAELTNGVLKITMPKPKGAKAHKVSIKG